MYHFGGTGLFSLLRKSDFFLCAPVLIAFFSTKAEPAFESDIANEVSRSTSPFTNAVSPSPFPSSCSTRSSSSPSRYQYQTGETVGWSRGSEWPYLLDERVVFTMSKVTEMGLTKQRELASFELWNSLMRIRFFQEGFAAPPNLSLRSRMMAAMNSVSVFRSWLTHLQETGKSERLSTLTQPIILKRKKLKTFRSKETSRDAPAANVIPVTARPVSLVRQFEYHQRTF